MGTEQTGIEDAFDAALSAAWGDTVPGRAGTGSTGIGLAGGFGTGKSHLLGYLAEVARQQGFVVSRVVVARSPTVASWARTRRGFAQRGATRPTG